MKKETKKGKMRKIFTALSLSGIVVLGITALNFSNLTEKSPKYVPINYGNQKTEQTAHGLMEIYKNYFSDPQTGKLMFAEMDKAYRDFTEKQLKKGNPLNLKWENLGPVNQGGRTRVLIVDNENSERLYTGAVSSGIWISDNGGNTWTKYSDHKENLLITSGAQAPNGDIYFGTGTNFETLGHGYFPGTGIYKSTDRGKTFTILPSTRPADVFGASGQVWSAVNDLIVSPKNSNHVFAATNTGLFVSTDAGATWTKPTMPGTGNNTECQSVKFSGDNNRFYVGFQGKFLYADDPINGPYTQSAVTIGTYARIQIATSPANANIVYATCVGGNGHLRGIYVSTDKGESFDEIDPVPPTTSPNWQLFGGNGQGYYDLASTVDPTNANRFFVGGVQMWRFDGNWTRATTEGGGPGNPFYVHADKHNYTWDPKDPNIVYCVSDGGVSKSLDAGVTWFDVNRNMVTTQFYGIAFDKRGLVLGGTQDNGVMGMDIPGITGFGNKDWGINISNQGVINGDGFDCEVSNIVDLKFTTAQNGSLGRSLIVSETGAGICGNYCELGPFWTTIRLWETLNDPYSQDSILFDVDTFRQGIGIGSGVKKSYTGKLTHPQVVAKPVYNTVYFTSSGMLVEDFDGDGILTGDGTGNVDPITGAFTVNFNTAPTVNSAVYVHFAVSYDAGDVLNLSSNTDNIPFTFTLPTALVPGDKLMIRDPVQSTLVSAILGGVILARGVLNLSEDVEWFNITALPNGNSRITGTPTAFEFSPDGDILYVGTNSGGLFKISNLSQLYKKNVLATNGTSIEQFKVRDLLKIDKIFQAPGGRTVAGLCLHPKNPEILLTTLAGFVTNSSATTSWIYRIDNAASANNEADAIVTNVRGDLPPIPVFDAEIDIRNPSITIIGTAYGAYSTKNLFATNVEWGNENLHLGNIPVFDVRQQRLNGTQAANHEMYYLGTYGRGIWATSSLVGIDENYTELQNTDFINSLGFYPNPVSLNATIALSLAEKAIGNIQVYDLTGKLVNEVNGINLTSGNNQIPFDASRLNAGTYIVIAKVNGQSKMAKFVKQ